MSEQGRISKYDLFTIHNTLKVASSNIANLIHYMEPKNCAAYEYGQLLDIAHLVYRATEKADTWASLNSVKEYVGRPYYKAEESKEGDEIEFDDCPVQPPIIG